MLCNPCLPSNYTVGAQAFIAYCSRRVKYFGEIFRPRTISSNALAFFVYASFQDTGVSTEGITANIGKKTFPSLLFSQNNFRARKKRGAAANYPIPRHRQTPVLQGNETTARALYWIVLAVWQRVYSRAQAFVVYYPLSTLNLAIFGIGNNIIKTLFRFPYVLFRMRPLTGFAGNWYEDSENFVSSFFFP